MHTKYVHTSYGVMFRHFGIRSLMNIYEMLKVFLPLWDLYFTDCNPRHRFLSTSQQMGDRFIHSVIKNLFIICSMQGTVLGARNGTENEAARADLQAQILVSSSWHRGQPWGQSAWDLGTWCSCSSLPGVTWKFMKRSQGRKPAVMRSCSVHMSLTFVFTGASIFYICNLTVTTFDILSATVQKPTHVTFCFNGSESNSWNPSMLTLTLMVYPLET